LPLQGTLTIAEDPSVIAGNSNSAEGTPAESAAYTVLARRYRPGRFEDCIGQEHVAQALKNAIDSQRVAHAYLFCGSRGVGKTSMARIFAKALNCQHGPTGNPCGQCESCLSITAGSDLDVVEIDGASNRGIEEIRELRAGVAYRPSRSRFKIYIIDEVHMLTKEAFNALLKTLEEPPAHVKFVFATTEAQKIPITILSRCQRYDFSGIGLPQIRQRLAEIVQAEGMTADEEALEIVARRARGSMRDSQSLLDQVLAYAAGHLSSDVVHRLLGTAGEERVLMLGQAIFAADAKSALQIIDQAIGEGVQLGEWVDQMLDLFRDLLVLSVDPNAAILSMADRHRQSLLALLQGQSTERIMEMMDILASARQRLRGSPLGRTIVEMNVVRLCRLDHFLSLTALALQPPAIHDRMPASTDTHAKKNDPVKPLNKGTGSDPTPQGSSENPVREVPVPRSPHAPNPLPSAAPTQALAHPHQPMAPSPPAVPLGGVISLDIVKQNWLKVRKSIDDPFLAATLEQVSELRFEPPRSITLAFPSTATVSKNRSEGAADLLAHAWHQILGQSVTLKFEQLPPDPNATPVSTSRSQLQLREDAARDPIVQQAEMLLGARIFDVVVLTPPLQANPISQGLADDDSDKRS
jgi:DNA polymerase-3 subunit gamma/tau